MRTKLILLAIFIVLAGSAYAQEDGISECASSDARIITTYNPADIMAIFGIEPVCENGMLNISTPEWNIGLIYGEITANEAVKKIRILKGGFRGIDTNIYEYPSDLNEPRIIGEDFIIDANDLNRIGFNINKGIYLKYDYFIASEEESSIMKAVFTKQYSYLNITGEGAIISKELFEEYKNGGNLGNKKTLISNLLMITVENRTNPAILAIARGRSEFGSLQIISEKTLKLRRWFSDELSGEFIDVAIGQDADIFADANSNYVINAENPIDGTNSMRIHINGRETFNLRHGAIYFMKDADGFEMCSAGRRYSVGGILLDKGSCLFMDAANDVLRFIPRRAEIRKDVYEGFNLQILYPTTPLFGKLDIFAFEKSDTLSTITLRREGVEGQMTFSKDDVILSENVNWFDFGSSFVTYVFDKSTSAFNKFECNIAEMKCYLDGSIVSGEFKSASGMLKCTENNDCPEGKVCRQKRCIRQATCERYRYIGEPSQKLDVVFISDAYDTKENFEQDVFSILEGNSANPGLFSIEPFSDASNKFNIWTLYTGTEPLPMMRQAWFTIVNPAEGYVNRIARACGNKDVTIVLSKSDFTSFSNDGGNAYLSIESENEWLPLVFIHEFGHNFGGLMDEYYYMRPGLSPQWVTGRPNCLSESKAENYWEPSVFAQAVAEGWRSCGGYCDERCASYLRPRNNSIMNDHKVADGDTFNSESIKWLQNRLARYRG